MWSTSVLSANDVEKTVKDHDVQINETESIDKSMFVERIFVGAKPYSRPEFGIVRPKISFIRPCVSVPKGLLTTEFLGGAYRLNGFGAISMRPGCIMSSAI
jgi:hypothetical protein